MNLFLPPFPETGLTLTYVDQINAIFTTFSNHTHESLAVDPFQLPNGNRIESGSIIWSTLNVDSNIHDVRSVSFYDEVSLLPVVNFLNVINGDLYFIKSGVGSIQITNRAYVNASATISGFIGDFQTYGVNLLFSTDSNDYTFTSNAGPIGILVNTLLATQVTATSVSASTLSITNAPDIPSNDGFAYFNSDGIFGYSQLSVIRLDNTTVAKTLVFDNLVTNNQPAIGFGAYPNVSLLGPSELSVMVVYSNQPGKAPTSISKYSYSDVWFPLATTDNKQMFFGQFFDPTVAPTSFEGAQKIQLWSAQAGSGAGNVSIRLVYSLNRAVNTSWNQTRINHYQMHPLNIDFGSPDNGSNFVYNTSDILIENTVSPTLIEKLALIDIRARDFDINLDLNYYYYFNFLFDFGDTVI